jgi:hypothetical protein
MLQSRSWFSKWLFCKSLPLLVLYTCFVSPSELKASPTAAY